MMLGGRTPCATRTICCVLDRKTTPYYKVRSDPLFHDEPPSPSGEFRRRTFSEAGDSGSIVALYFPKQKIIQLFALLRGVDKDSVGRSISILTNIPWDKFKIVPAWKEE